MSGSGESTGAMTVRDAVGAKLDAMGWNWFAGSPVFTDVSTFGRRLPTPAAVVVRATVLFAMVTIGLPGATVVGGGGVGVLLTGARAGGGVGGFFDF